MGKVNTKDNIWVEGFDQFDSWAEGIENLLEDIQHINIIYAGRALFIPTHLASTVVESIQDDPGRIEGYRDYTTGHCVSLRESINSVCRGEYYIVYEINKS